MVELLNSMPFDHVHTKMLQLGSVVGTCIGRAGQAAAPEGTNRPKEMGAPGMGPRSDLIGREGAVEARRKTPWGCCACRPGNAGWLASVPASSAASPSCVHSGGLLMLENSKILYNSTGIRTFGTR